MKKKNFGDNKQVYGKHGGNDCKFIWLENTWQACSKWKSMLGPFWGCFRRYQSEKHCKIWNWQMSEDLSMREVLVPNLAQYQLCHHEWAYLVRERAEWSCSVYHRYSSWWTLIGVKLYSMVTYLLLLCYDINHFQDVYISPVNPRMAAVSWFTRPCIRYVEGGAKSEAIVVPKVKS